MFLEIVLNTLNMVVGPVENFLQRFEKCFYLKKYAFFTHFETDFGVKFLKKSMFWAFPRIFSDK